MAIAALAAVAASLLLATGLASRTPGPAIIPPDGTAGLNIEYGFTLPGAARVNDEPFPISSLAVQGDTLWAGSDLQGLFALRDGRLSRLYDGVIYSLLPEQGGRLLAGYAHFHGRQPVSRVAGTNGGVALLGRPVYLSEQEEEMGLGRWDGERWAPLWAEEAVWDLVRDREGQLYLSTNDGVYLYEDEPHPGSGAPQARHLGLTNTLCFGLLYDDATGVLLVGALGGVWRYAEGEWQHVLELPGHKALDFARGEAGRLYAATSAGLYTSEDGVAWRQAGETVSLRTVLLTPVGLFAAGSGGVYALENGALVNAGEHPQVRALAWHEGRLYAGTNDGLWRLAPRAGP